MKAIVYILILFCATAIAQNGENNLEIDIRGKDCNGGLSFCTIKTTSTERQNSQKYSFHKISESELQFTITISELTTEEQKMIFGKEIRYISASDTFFFKQEFDFELNSDCIKYLGLNSKSSIIKSDNYQIKLIENKAIINLKLSTKI